MIQAVIFDFDGLLADTEIISYRIYRDILKNYGYHFDQKTYASFYSGKTEEENTRKLIDTYQISLSFEDCFRQIKQLEKQYFMKGVDLKPGARELLDYLKDDHYKTAVASSSESKRAMSVLKDHGIDTYFDAFVFAEDITRSKPDPQIFLKAAEKLHVSPENCLVLEDSEAGIEAAFKADMKTICIPDMKRPPEESLIKTAATFPSLVSVIDYLCMTEQTATI